jgi:light-regulated signal transduction histidine kinase (bacteriophytochrome)
MLLQGFGAVLVCDDRAALLHGHSAHLADFFPAFAPPFVGRGLRELFGSETTHRLRNALSRPLSRGRPALLAGCQLDGAEGLFDLSTYTVDEQAVIELEPAAAAAPWAALDLLQILIDRCREVESAPVLAQVAARLLASLLQYDSAVFARRHVGDEWEILGEQKRPSAPGCDSRAFGKLAGELRPGRLRLIADARAATSALVLAPEAEPFDLGGCLLRAPSSAEIILAGEGDFAASMALGLYVGGDLWGAIWCRSRAPKNLSIAERAAVELFGDFLALQARRFS